jgi:hypothetical protein
MHSLFILQNEPTAKGCSAETSKYKPYGQLKMVAKYGNGIEHC